MFCYVRLFVRRYHASYICRLDKIDATSSTLINFIMHSYIWCTHLHCHLHVNFKKCCRLLQQYVGLFETSFVRRLRPIVSSPGGGSDECKQKMEVPETTPSYVLNDDCQIQGKAKSWGFLCVMCTYFVIVSHV